MEERLRQPLDEVLVLLEEHDGHPGDLAQPPLQVLRDDRDSVVGGRRTKAEEPHRKFKKKTSRTLIGKLIQADPLFCSAQISFSAVRTGK